MSPAKLIYILLVSAEVVLIVTGKYMGPINAAGLNLIKEFEGFRGNFYRDPAGIRTIGFGHACNSLSCEVPIYGKYDVPLTRASATALLQEDIRRGGYENCVNSAVTYNQLTANQYSALVSLVYNLGCGNFRKSTLRNKLNQGNVKAAAGEFGKWVKAGGRRLNGLVRRRAAERQLFCKGSTTC